MTMSRTTTILRAAICAALAFSAVPVSGAVAPAGAPDAAVDLDAAAGQRALGLTWRVADARIEEVPFRAVGADRKPSGAPNRTYDVVPHAEGVAFDDAAWRTLAPGHLAERIGNGKVSFAWYRARLTLPETLGGVPVRGATLVLETVVDDYAELWVDGRLPRELGTAGGTVVAGFNAPNRVVVAEDAQPGQKVQLALFAANGPISVAPENYIWIRYARLDVYAGPRGGEPAPVATTIVRLDPALDAIVPPGATLERLGSGFRFTEGPLWRDGRFVFSDPNANRIYERAADGRVRVLRERSGYQGADVAEYGQPGSNGLTLDGAGRLTIAEHGNHRISRLEADGRLTVLADAYQGKRLNSPNDLVYRSDGTLFFTDPPFGLPKFGADPRKELAFSGVYALAPGGPLRLLTDALKGPNGLAFSPDERFLYVGDWDEKHKVVTRYEVAADGTLSNALAFADLGDLPGSEAIDGVKTDRLGNVYVSGPGGLWIYSSAGKRLGAIVGPELAANFTWGDADGKGLYLTARHGIYRIRLGVPGIRPAAAEAGAPAVANAAEIVQPVP
jgi:gluconolactonase